MPEVSPVGKGPLGPVNRNTASERMRGRDELRQDQPQESTTDRVELSRHAQLMEELRRLPETRVERVEAVRAALQSGDYETEERLQVAIDRLLQDLD